jgi:hypothetical protein
MGLGSGIRDPGSGIRKRPNPDPGSRGQKGAGSRIATLVVHLLRRCAKAVKAEWNTVDDCLRFWATDYYHDDEASKLLLIRKLKEGAAVHSGSMITIFILYSEKGEIMIDEEVEMTVFDSQSMACLKKFCAQLLFQPDNSLLFLYKGREVQDSETPASLGMVDRSIIHCYILE